MGRGRVTQNPLLVKQLASSWAENSTGTSEATSEVVISEGLQLGTEGPASK